MGDARGLHLKGAAHLRGSAPLPCMQRDGKAAAASDVEAIFECQWIREGRLATSEIEGHHTKVLGGNRCRCEVAILFQRMGAERGDDQAHLNVGFCGCASRPRRNGSDHLRLREPLCSVQVRPPAHLKIGDVLCRLGAHQLLGGAVKRLCVLQERDRQIECAKKVGLIGTALGGDQRGAHPCPIPRGINVPRGGEF